MSFGVTVDIQPTEFFPQQIYHPKHILPQMILNMVPEHK